MDPKKLAIRNFYIGHKRLPTYKEMEGLLGYSSKGSVRYYVHKLIEEGFLAREQKKIVRGRQFFALKVLGLVEAGFPTIADEDASNTLSLDELLIDHKEATYMLSVKGDSMKDAGILDGDMVLIDRTESPRPDKIVVAEIDGAYTLKYLRKKDGKLFLEAANKAFKPMYPTEELRIQGVVTAVIRKY